MAAVATAITVNFQVQITNANYRETIAPGAAVIAQQNPGRYGGVQTILSASITTIVVTGVTTNGWCFLRNLDATNYVTYGYDVAGTLNKSKLLAGEFAWFRMAAGATLYAQADTANVRLDIRLLEN